MYYFAYGSNMNFKQMKERCPNGRFLKRVYVIGYKFVYDGHSSLRNCAVANIVRSENDVVWGAVFEIDSDCINSLDQCEGWPVSYQKETKEVKDEKGNTYQATVYLRNPLRIGKPSDEYREILINGAKDCGLPEEYVEKFIKA